MAHSHCTLPTPPNFDPLLPIPNLTTPSPTRWCPEPLQGRGMKVISGMFLIPYESTFVSSRVLRKQCTNLLLHPHSLRIGCVSLRKCQGGRDGETVPQIITCNPPDLTAETSPRQLPYPCRYQGPRSWEQAYRNNYLSVTVPSLSCK